MHQLKLVPEIQRYPTLVCWEEEFDNACPASFGVSGDLARVLNAWAESWAECWDAIYDLVNDPANPKFDSPAGERIFWGDGRKLANRHYIEPGSERAVNLDTNELTA
jgi:hypothetical protein